MGVSDGAIQTSSVPPDGGAGIPAVIGSGAQPASDTMASVPRASLAAVLFVHLWGGDACSVSGVTSSLRGYPGGRLLPTGFISMSTLLLN
jgi:hypothetical protein